MTRELQLMFNQFNNLNSENRYTKFLKVGLDSINTFEKEKEIKAVKSEGYLRLIPSKYQSGQIGANTLAQILNDTQSVVSNVINLKEYEM